MVFRRATSFSNLIYSWYERHPFMMNSLIGGGVYVAGEVIVEMADPVVLKRTDDLIEEEQQSVGLSKQWQKFTTYLNKVEIDWQRVGLIGLLGVAENGIFMLMWYNFLSKVVGNDATTRTVIYKCILDQLFFATQQDSIFLGYCAYLQSSKLKDAWKEMSEQFLTTWLNDCSLWPIVNFIGFAYIPTKLQPTYMSAVQFFWQIYISSMAKNGNNHTEERKKLLEEMHTSDEDGSMQANYIHTVNKKNHSEKMIEDTTILDESTTIVKNKSSQLTKGLKHFAGRVKEYHKDSQLPSTNINQSSSTSSSSSEYPLHTTTVNPTKVIQTKPSYNIFETDDPERLQAMSNMKMSVVVMTSLIFARKFLARI